MTDTPVPADVLTPAAASSPPLPEAEAAAPAPTAVEQAPPAPAAAPEPAPPPVPEKPAFAIPLDLGRIAQDLQLRKAQVEHVAQLFDEGYEVPFLAAFRKERTGGLTEEALRQIQKRLQLQKQVADRKQAILRNLQTHGKLTDDLRNAIIHADTNKRLEDLYLPFKPKKKSAAAAAREKGLEPFAQAIFNKDPAVANLAELWPTFINPDKQLGAVEEVHGHVKQLLAEMLAEQPAARDAARRWLWEQAKLTVTRNPAAPEGQGQEFKDYFQFSDGLRHLVPHRIAAINRGEKAGILTVKLEFPAPALLEFVKERAPLGDHPHGELLRAILPDAVSQFLAPALEREIRRDLTEKAEEHAVQVVAKNLRRMLLQPALPPTRLLAIDPGFRAGCRIAVLDEKGELLEHAVIHPHASNDKRDLKRAKKEETKPTAEAEKPEEAKSSEVVATEAAAPTVAPPAEAPTPAPKTAPAAEASTPAPAEAAAPTEPAKAEPPAPTAEQKRAEAKATLEALIKKHNVQAIALGNGPGCRDTEELLTELIAERLPELSYHVVPEHGAGQYALSPLGREEFPNVEGPVRAAISLGRRLQDPLRELVKIDPVQLGLGFAHHDIPEKRLREALAAVVESCVNEVGLDVNAAGVPQLRHVAGLNPLRAASLVQHRQVNGPFKSREELKTAAGMNELAWTQSIGFLRLPEAEQPFDRTWVHPDLYPTAVKVLESVGADASVLSDDAKLEPVRQKFAELDLETEGAKHGLAPAAFDDLLRALARPGKDPRSDHPAPLFKKKQLRVEDLQPGMELRGTVLNVVDFGAFIDVGLKDNGLVHISQLANRFVKSPYDLVFVGDVVTVWTLNVDQEKRRVSLTMIPPGSDRKPAERRPAPPPRGERQQRPDGDRPPRREPRFSAQVATPGRPSGPLPNVQREMGPQRSGNRPPPRPQPERRPPPPKKDRPLPKLTQEALKGKSALRTFGELKALYEAKKPDDPKPTVATATLEPAPSAAPESPPAEAPATN